MDKPERVNGVAMIVNPNFRELHSAEQPALLRPIIMPIVEGVQRTLREKGQGLFDVGQSGDGQADIKGAVL